MLKKAKLYSLLAIIVASTVVGLSFQGTAYADCSADKCITWGGEKIDTGNGLDYYDSLLYQDGNTSDDLPYYLVTPTVLAAYRTDSDFEKSACGSSPLVYSRTYGPPGMNIICFTEDGTAANFLNFPNAETSQTTEGNLQGSFGDTDTDQQKSLTVDGEAVTGIEKKTEAADGIIDEITGDEPASTPSSCQIKGIGWLICPVVNFLAEVTDKSYEMLDNTFLRLEPIILPGSGNADREQLYSSWKMMRDFANIIFIIGFLVIVFSQITSFGVSNYGIKQLLPKIIIAAILVNLSYLICAVAVDISNILGNQLRDLLTPEGGAKLMFNFVHDGEEIGGPSYTGFTGAASIVLGATISAAVVYIFLPTFLPIALGAALAAATAVLALTLRQALVVILVVASPLAFVALLLPNTEGYFQKWKSLFIAMLLVYPIISIVFGASALASNILMSTNDFPTQMIGAGVSIIPLFITPIIMKASGGLLNRWVGMVNDPSKGPVDALKKGVGNKAQRLDNRRRVSALRGEGRRFMGGRYQRKARGAAVDASLEANAKRAETSYISKEAQNNTSFQNELAGGMNVPIVGGKDLPMPFDAIAGKTILGKTMPDSIPTTIGKGPTQDDLQRALAGAINVEAKLVAEEVSAANAIINKANLSLSEIQSLAKGESVTTRDGKTISGGQGSSLQTAAIQNQFEAGDVAMTDELVKLSGSMGVDQRQEIAKGMQKLSSKVHYYGGAASDIVKSGAVSDENGLDKLVADSLEGGKVSSTALNNSDKDALDRTAKVVAEGYKDAIGNIVKISAEADEKLHDATIDALTNENLPQAAPRIRERITAVKDRVPYAGEGKHTPPPLPKSTPKPSAPTYGPPMPWDLKTPEEKAINPNDV